MSKEWLARTLISLGLIIILFAMGFLWYQQRADDITAEPLPDSVANLPMIRIVIGSNALDELSWLHGQEFQLNKGAVGTYGKGSEITLYAAGTPFDFMASRLLVAMRDKIARSNTLFTPIAERELGGGTVYELQGMGQRHFYFRSNNLVVWLAADEPYAEQALEEILEFFP